MISMEDFEKEKGRSMYVGLGWGEGGRLCFIYIACLYIYVCMYQPDLEQEGRRRMGGPCWRQVSFDGIFYINMYDI